jgi:Trypsin-like peptidase domain
MRDRLRQLGREARNSSAPIILVLASLVSACAAVAGLKSWISVGAAVAAVMSGGQVLRNELIVPLRIRSVENATLRIVSGPWNDRSERWTRGTAFQIASNHWVTAWHVIGGADEIYVKLKGENTAAQVLYKDEDTDLAVLSVSSEWAWQAKAAHSVPDFGDKIKVIGWTSPSNPYQPALRIGFDYLVQGQSDADMIALTGPDPQLGFSGAPAIEMRSGRVVGILNSFYSGEEEKYSGAPKRVPIVFARPISDIPAEYR